MQGMSMLLAENLEMQRTRSLYACVLEGALTMWSIASLLQSCYKY